MSKLVTRRGLLGLGLALGAGVAGFTWLRNLRGAQGATEPGVVPTTSAARVNKPNVMSPRAFVPQVTGSALSFKSVFFNHHSIGANLILGGNMRPTLTALGYQLWDHSYERDGLFMPNGTKASYTYNIPDDETGPAGYAAIFAQNLYTTPVHPSPPQNAFSGFMRHQVILFKSNNWDSKISSDAMVEDYKTSYRSIRARADQYTDRIFILLGYPPCHPCETNHQDALRARAFVNWLKSAEYLSGHPNIFMFDLFDLLAEPNTAAADYSMLRAAYRSSECDSHPQLNAAEAIGPLLCAFIDNSVRSYTGHR
jgi:hypothetical protein